MGINHWEWEAIGLQKIFPLISSPYSVDCSSCISSSEVQRIYRGTGGPDPQPPFSYHLYTDTQVIASTTMTHAERTVDRLRQCVAEIQRWCSSRRLQMNPHKTELIWFRSRTNLQKVAALPRTSSLTVTYDVVQSVNLNATSESPSTVNYRCRIMSTKSLELASITFDD